MVAEMGSLQSGQTRLASPASQAAQMQRCAQGSSSTLTCALQQTAHCVAGASPSSGAHAAEPADAASSAAAVLSGGSAAALSGGSGESGGCSPFGPNTTNRNP